MLLPGEYIYGNLIILGIFGLGVLVFLTNRRGKVNKNFALLSLSIGFLILFALLSEIPKDLNQSLILSRICLAFLPLFGVFLFFFSLVFPQEKPFSSLFKNILLIGAVLLSLVTIFTNLMVKGIEPVSWGFNLVYGNLFTLSTLFWILTAGWGSFNLLKNYKKVSPEQKMKMKYLLFGLGIFILTSFFVNVPLRMMIDSDIYYRIGNYSLIFFIGFTAYAIIAKKLFGIIVILTELLVTAIGLVMIIQIFMAPDISWRLINGIVFALFIIFGYYLIRATIREIQRREEVEKISKAKSEFLSIASHQLRTPLSAIKGYLSMISEGTYGGIPEKAKKAIDNVYQSNERLVKLVNAFLDISRIEMGVVEIDFEMSSVEDLISEIISEIEIKAREKNLYLKFEGLEEPLPKISLDKGKIKEVILNLLDNAIKYTQKGGITIKTRIQNTKCYIQISDTGEGLTKEETGRLFESFVRGEAGARFWTEGAGLGLYVSRKFIELHKGKIWAESPGKGKGSTFYIELPIK